MSLALAEASEKKQRRKGGTRRRFSKGSAKPAEQKPESADVQVMPQSLQLAKISFTSV